MRKKSAQRLVVVLFAIAICSSIACSPAVVVTGQSGSSKNKSGGNTKSVWKPPAPLDSARAFGYLEQICNIGTRISGSPGMLKQQQLLEKHFVDLGATVLAQSFEYPHPINGKPVPIKNIVVQWHPELTTRVLICTHYDTRPYPSQDRKNKQGVFIGANDGGSGTALLMELGHAMKGMPLNVGVDFVFFDAEEFLFQERSDGYFVGSTYFARAYAENPSQTKYRAGILLDMIGDAELQINYEENSFRFAPHLVKEVWGIAAELNINEFVPKIIHTVRDDHLPLNEIGRIPTIDLIDFDYPAPGSQRKKYWHTTDDTPDKCSGDSMTKVGAVVLEWIKRQK